MADIYGSTEDGYLIYGIVVNKTSTALFVGAESSGSQDVDGAEYHGILFFNTSILGADATIITATLTFTIEQVIGDFPPGLGIWMDNGAAGSTLTGADYKTVINNGEKIARIPGDPDEMPGTWQISINSSYFDQINKTDYTNIEFDAEWGGVISSTQGIYISTQEHATVAYRPKLSITYRKPLSFNPKTIRFGNEDTSIIRGLH